MVQALTPLSRRRFTLGIVGLTASLTFVGARPALAALPAPKSLIARRFNVFWGKDAIGTHAFKIAPTGVAGDWDVTVDIDMRVDLGLFGEIVYRHTSREAWRDGRIVELASWTDDDGDIYELSGRADGAYFRMEGPGGPFEAPGDMLTSNCAWSEAICQRDQIIDATEGAVVGLVATLDGTAIETTARGQHAARIYQVISPIIAGSFWYDETGVWVKGRLERSGEEIDYVLAA